MDAFSLLKADHRKVAELFEQLESASGKNKLSVFEQIKSELELHTHIEETVFYPAVEEPKETHDLTLEAYEEHDVVKKLLQELSRARSVSDEWEAQAKVLQENVEHHVDEEENELFKKASKVLSRQEIETLGEQLESEKARKQRGAASKTSSSKKSARSNKSASKTTAASRAPKRTRKGSKKSSGWKSSGTKSRGRSGSKKSASKKR